MPRFAAFALVLALAACAPAHAPVQRIDGASMGTTWSAQLIVPEERVPALRELIVAELDDVVAQMSSWEPTSALSRFNSAPAGSWQELPAGLAAVFAHALALARDTGGAYDPTVGALVELWGFGTGEARDAPPAAAEITAAKQRVGFAKITLDGNRALQPGGVAMDVASLGPGHALDRIAARLRDAGVASFLIELGGETLAAGRKPDGSDWRIAVEPARLVDGEPDYDLIVALRDAAAGSSGDYRVGFEHAGRRYSHTIDPRTGEPVQHALAGVTVIAPRAMEADAMAAALMVLGPDEGMAFATRRDVAAVFTLRDADGSFARRYTPAFERLRAP